MSSSTVTLAGKQVGRMGYGLMQLTWTTTPPPQEVSFAAMKAAADSGATAWSTAMFYGNPPDNQLDNLHLIADFFKKYPEYKDKIVIVLKGGLSPNMGPSGDIEHYRTELKKAQEILGDKHIDVYSLARLPPQTAKEEVFQNLATLQKEGRFGHVGASEMKAETLELLQKYAPVSVIEIEVSLWSYDSEIQDVLAWSRKHSVPVFCYSPLGRGFITRTWKSPDDIPAGNFQKHSPRFQGEAFYENLKLVDQLDELAEKKGLATSQLALAWLTSISPFNIPIPGSSNVGRVKSNSEAANIKLTEEDLKGINETLAKFEPKGGRYPDYMNGLQMQ